jgi:two-component system chemotaxis response regulator CheY
MRTFVRRVAELSGIEVERYFQAANGEEALALLQREPVDVVLTDVNMPRMNGEELLRNLEADERFRNVPVLVISTDGTETRVHRMMALGAKGYVKKPFLPEILREELERVLGGQG